MDYEKIAAAVRLCGSTPSTIECLGSCPFYGGGDMNKCIPAMTKAAADAIEQLIKLRDMAQAERDAAHKALIQSMVEAAK